MCECVCFDRSIQWVIKCLFYIDFKLHECKHIEYCCAYTSFSVWKKKIAQNWNGTKENHTKQMLLKVIRNANKVPHFLPF